MRANKPISVTLGKLQEAVDRRVASGAYSSASEVLREGLRALVWREEILDEILREKVRKSLADPRASVPAGEAFARLRGHMRSVAK